jgi:hypothetical protein
MVYIVGHTKGKLHYTYAHICIMFFKIEMHAIHSNLNWLIKQIWVLWRMIFIIFLVGELLVNKWNYTAMNMLCGFGRWYLNLNHKENKKDTTWLGNGHDLWCFVIFQLVPFCLLSQNGHHKYYGDLKSIPSFQRQRFCACKESQPTYSSYSSQYWLMHIQMTRVWFKITWNWKQNWIQHI